MHWFLIALVGPILYAFVNHTDKYLISKYLKNGEVGALIIFSSTYSIVALPIVYLINPAVFDVSLKQGLLLAVNGTLTILALLPYFYALHEEEASFVVPYYQTVPLFAFVLGYLLLGETITWSQAGASMVVMAGALVLSFSLDAGKMLFKKKVVLFMLASSLLYAINGVLFKFIAIEEGFWLSTFWGLVGKVVLGFGFLAFISSYRTQFLSMIGQNKAAVLGLNMLSESMSIVAEAVMQYASLLAPVVLVLLVSSFQPFFVLIIGVVLTTLLPSIGKESMTRDKLIQKVMGMTLIGVGGYFLAV